MEEHGFVHKSVLLYETVGSLNLRWHLSINQYYCMKRLTA